MQAMDVSLTQETTLAGEQSQAVAASGSRTLWMMLLALELPAFIALVTIQKPTAFIDFNHSPSPQGYSWSLGLFILPMALTALWFMARQRGSLQRKAMFWTLASLIPLGFGLDILFATSFFTFKNTASTIGVTIPVVGGEVPIEEFIFYFTGFVATLLGYVWADEEWFAAYRTPEVSEEEAKRGRIELNWWAIPVGIVICALAYAFKNRPGALEPGFPGYLAFLLVAAVIPTMVLWPAAKPFINWRALAFVVLTMLLVCVVWEATLGVPQQWWGYQSHQMTGVFINAWAGLPVEEMIVWHMVSFMTVTVYEVVKVRVGLRGE